MSEASHGELLQDLTASDPKLRREAARILGEVGDASSLSPLVVAATGDRSAQVRREARAAIQQIGTRTGANLTLEALSGAIPLRSLVEALAIAEEETRAWAMSIIHPSLVARLIREGHAAREKLTDLPRASVTKVGWWAGLVLAELGDVRAVGALDHSLRNGSKKTRAWILQVIGELGYLRLVEFLCNALNDAKLKPRDRRSAAQGLGGLAHPAALPALRHKARLFSLEDGGVKVACREAIKRIELRGVAGLPMASAVASPAAPSITTLPSPASKPAVDAEMLPRAVTESA